MNGGGKLSTRELDYLRLQTNLMQNDSVAEILDVGGNLKPDALGKTTFRTLPHECASLRFDTQEISSGTTYQTPAVLDPSGATWNHGFSIDTSNAQILVKRQAKGAVIAFVLWWQWAGNATGRRALQWTDNSGNGVQDFEFSPDATIATFLHVPHVRKAAAADTYYSLKVYQNSGAGLNGDGLLTAWRIR